MAGLPIDKVRIFGDPLLKQPPRPVERFDEDLRELAEMMYQVMEREHGVGLAATQIGMNKSFMVWQDPETEERGALANPRIVERSEDEETDDEGCLSLPGHLMPVSRSLRIVVEGQDLTGELRRIEVSGFLARIFQHEVDHLEGKLILDRTTREERKRILREIREQTLGL